MSIFNRKKNSEPKSKEGDLRIVVQSVADFHNGCQEAFIPRIEEFTRWFRNEYHFEWEKVWVSTERFTYQEDAFVHAETVGMKEVELVLCRRAINNKEPEVKYV